MQRFEYDFVRLGAGYFGVRGKAARDYQEIVHRKAREGWRLVQIFAPGTGIYGHARYFELIFERDLAAVRSPQASSAAT